MTAAAPEVDIVDQQIIAALQINGRASWKDIACATGISESTVVRRGKRLFETNVLQVTAYVDVVRAGLGNPVLVRLSSNPLSYTDVMIALRARPDVRFCASTTGPAAFVVEIVAPDRAALAELLSHELAQIKGITQLETLSITRTFHSVRAWNESLLTDEALTKLRPPHLGAPKIGDSAEVLEPVTLDSVDRELITLLASNGRLSNKELAARLNISTSTVGRRLARLELSGVIHFRTVLAAETAGFSSQLLIWMQVESGRLDELISSLVDHPATKFVWATAGRFNVCLGIQLADIRDMYFFETGFLSKLPGIQMTEVNEHLQDIRRSWVVLNENGGPSDQSTASEALTKLFEARESKQRPSSMGAASATA